MKNSYYLAKPLTLTFLSALIFLLTAAFHHLYAQACSPGSITLSTQMEINNFQTDHGPCTEVTGVLRIEGAGITNVDGLSGLTSVGSLVIQNCPDLLNLNGLSTLSISAGGQFTLINADKLVTADLSGVNAPQLSVFSVQHNDALTSFAMPGFIVFDGRSCLVWGNPNLHTLDLSGLTTIDDSSIAGLQIGFNNLSSVDLSSLTTSNGLRIEDEYSLADLSLLGNLETLTGWGITLSNIPLLSDINWLSKLATFDGLRLILKNLPLIPDINPLSNLASPSITSGGQFTIQNVDAITTADLSNFSAPQLSIFKVQLNDALTSFAMPGFIAFDGHSCFVWDNPNLHTLDLSGLTTIDDSSIAGLQIGFNNLSSVDLSSLTTSNGLRIEDEYSLADLSLLGNLETLTGWGITLSNIPLLSDINWLSKLATFDGLRLILKNLPLIPDINPLSNLASPSMTSGGQFTIQNVDAVTTADLSNFSAPQLSIFKVQLNDALTSFAMPGFITFDGRSCFVWDNPNLQTLDLSGLTTIDDSSIVGLQIGFNNLGSVDLSSLTTSNGLIIENEPVLSSLDGLPNLIGVAGNLIVRNNANLCDCLSLTSVLDNTDDGDPGPGPGPDGIPDVSGNVIIQNNLPGCNSVAEVPVDGDGDGLPDPCDDCDNNLEGMSCDDNEDCTVNDRYDADCNCVGTLQDADGDTVCDLNDVCPGFDDLIDVDDDEIPDGCDDCPNDPGNSCCGSISCSGTMLLFSQAAVDAFDCQGVFDGYLYIQGSDITDLSPLCGITAINGSFGIAGTSLTDLHGLENLTSIAGIFEVQYNDNLLSFAGLSSLTSIGSDFSVQNNPVLQNFSDMNELTTIGRSFVVQFNPSLEDFTGLSSLSSIERVLQARENTSLQSFAGLNSLTEIGWHLDATANVNLQNFAGLHNLASIVGHLRVKDNYALQDFTGLENLSTIGGFVQVRTNLALQNFAGLESLSSIGTYFTVRENPSLLDFSGLNSLVSVGSHFTIDNNG